MKLRYFNVAGGAGDKGGHIVPRALEAIRQNKSLTVNGDGSCARDYIHVEDVAAANVAALQALVVGERGFTVDICTGNAKTVLEVVATCEAVAGKSVGLANGPRRPGDPQQIAGSPEDAERLLGWKAGAGLTSIVQSAWEAA